jgi:hypothetical protein
LIAAVFVRGEGRVKTYLIRVESIEQTRDGLTWVLRTDAGRRLRLVIPLGDLWGLRKWLDALGVEVRDEPTRLKKSELVGRRAMVSVEGGKVMDYWAPD